MMKELGLKSFRFSISWSRVFPEGPDRLEQRGLDYYGKASLTAAHTRYGLRKVMDFFGLQVLDTLTEFHGTNTLGLSEGLREIAKRGETKKLGNLRHRQVGFCQKILAFADPT